MTRKDDLEQHITETAGIIHQYETTLRESSDPKEQARARRMIGEQHGLLQDYLGKYEQLQTRLRFEPPQAVVEIATTLGPDYTPPPITAPPPNLPNATGMFQWISIRWRRLFYRKHYVRYLVERHGYLDITRLVTRGPFPLESSAMFIPPHLETWKPDDTDQGIVPALPREGRYDIWDCLRSETWENLHMALLAGPGYGKTTLLKHVVLTLTERKQSNHLNIPIKIPVFLPLRELVSSICTNPQDFSLLDAIQQRIRNDAGPEDPPGWFSAMLERGRCLVLFDGLDEVVDEDSRKQVVTWLDQQMIAYANNRFIVREQPLNRLIVLEVMTFNDEQVADFVGKWYLTIERMDAQGESLEVQCKAEEKAEDLLRQIEQTTALSFLSRNPLLLTMMVHVHHYKGVLPKRRVDLYEEIVAVLLDDPQRPVISDMPLEHKQFVLRSLAYTMMSDQLHEIVTEDATKVISTSLVNLSSEVTGDEYLKTIEEISGLLCSNNQRYRFAHLTFQEYLAAVEIKTTGRGDELVKHVGDSWWYETIRLYCAMIDDATPIIQACLTEAIPSEIKLRLALECLDEARAVQPGIQEQLEQVFYRCLEHAEYKPMISRALATIRSNRFLRMADERYRDTTFISHMEYQVFLHTMHQQERYHHPDHWCDWHFPTNQGREPVVGIRPSDAVAFCAWLEQNDDTGKWCYRVPRIDEVEREGLFQEGRGTTIGFWVTTEGGWICYRQEDSSLITRERVRSQILSDIFDPHDYTPSELFRSTLPLWTPARMLQYLSSFDFSRQHTRTLSEQIRERLADIRGQIKLLVQAINALREQFELMSSGYRDRGIQIDQEIAKLRIEIDLYEIHRSSDYKHITEKYHPIYTSINEVISVYRDRISQVESKRDALDEQIQSTYRPHYAQIDEKVSAYERDIARIKDLRREKLNEISYEFQDYYNQIDWNISERQHNIDEIEQHRSHKYWRLQSQYQEQYARCDQDVATLQRNIDRIEAEHRNEYRDIQSHYQGQYAQIDRMINQEGYDVHELESERARLQAAEQQNYADADALANQNRAVIQQGIDHYESERARLQAAEQQNYTLINHEFDQGVVTLRSSIEELQQLRHTLQAQEQERRTDIDRRGNQAISTYQSHITQCEYERRDYQAQEQAERDSVDRRIDPDVNPLNDRITHYEQERSRYTDAAKRLGDKSLELQRIAGNPTEQDHGLLDRLSHQIEMVSHVLQKLNGFSNDYFSDDRHSMHDVRTALQSIRATVLRNLPKRGHATFGVQFLLLRRLPGSPRSYTISTGVAFPSN